MRKIVFFRVFLILLALIFILTACGQKKVNRSLMEYEPYNKENLKQSKSGITVKKNDVRMLPQEFIHILQKCDYESGKMIVNSSGDPVMEKRYILPEYAFMYVLTITSNLDHTARLSESEFILTDPEGNNFNAQNINGICAALHSERPCPNTSELCNELNKINVLTQDTELFPNKTEKFYLVFMPENNDISGTWELAMNSIPVEIDESGTPTETVDFNFKTKAQRHRAKYRVVTP